MKLRTALKNKVNNILSARGINQAKEALSSEKQLDAVLALPFDELVRVELRVIVAQIRSLNQSIRELEKAIAEEGSKLEGNKNLACIRGHRQDHRSRPAQRHRRCQRLSRRATARPVTSALFPASRTPTKLPAAKNPIIRFQSTNCFKADHCATIEPIQRSRER